MIPIPEKEAFLVVEEEGCYLVGEDGKAGGRLRWQELEEGLYAQTGFEAEQVVTEDGRILVAIELDAESGGKRIAALAYPADPGEGPETSLYPIEYEFIKDLCLEESRYQQGADLLYVTANHSERTESALATAGLSGRLQAFDLTGQRELWRYEIADGWLYDVGFARREGSHYLLCQKYSDALLLDRRDGTQIDTFLSERRSLRQVPIRTRMTLWHLPETVSGIIWTRTTGWIWWGTFFRTAHPPM